MPDSHPRVCISAGHGLGSRKDGQVDPGANVAGMDYEEADVTLSVAKSVYRDFARLFAVKGRGYVFLRDEGRFYLADDDAVKRACDVFVELHTDAASKSATGTSCLYEAQSDKPLAVDMATRVSVALGTVNRGAKNRTDLAVLNPHRHITQVLLEMFFGTNPNDVAKYRAHRDALVLAIVNSILHGRGWNPLRKRPSKMTKAALRLYKPY